MNGKKSKKIRQLYRREVRQQAQDIANVLGNNLKPKPRWVPMKVWVGFIKIFMKVQ